MGLQQCDYCSALFNSFGSKLCNSCVQELDEAFLRARKYIYKNPRRTDFSSVMENADVSEKALQYLIRQGRLQVSGSPGSAIGCRICGKPTSGGTLCDSCMRKFSEENKAAAVQQEEKQVKRSNGIQPLSHSKRD